MIIFRHFDKISSNIFHIICQNLIRQFLKVTFNEIFCKLSLFLFYGTPAYYIASSNSCWLLWPKCWLETEFDNRLRLRFSLLIQLILGKCGLVADTHTPLSEVVWAKSWAQYLKITLNALKNIPDIIPSVHRVLPWGPFLPLLDEKKLPKTGSEPRTPGFTAKHTTTDLWSQAYDIYRKFCVLSCNMT